jgi:hypothetical protein
VCGGGAGLLLKTHSSIIIYMSSSSSSSSASPAPPTTPSSAPAPLLNDGNVAEGCLDAKEEAAVEQALSQAEGDTVTLQAKVNRAAEQSRVQSPIHTNADPRVACRLCCSRCQWKTHSYSLRLPLDRTVAFLKMQIAIHTNVKVRGGQQHLTAEQRTAPLAQRHCLMLCSPPTRS